MRVRVMRQVHFSTADQRSIDLVFFVNGLPVATVELKTDFTQSLDEAINQYRKDRHPLTNGRPEPLLSFGHRALVHFAVSNDLAAMTTRLEGEKTHFLPFNIGYDSGAGNPPGADGRSATAYLWERVWEKDAWLTIIGRLMIVETKEEWDVATGTSVRRTSMLFPRFHQWEAVTNIVAAVREEGVGQRYLIEHSAGSGKTNTIAWTAHRLARLHVNDEKVFDSVIVVVDRTVLVAGDAGPVELTEGQRHLHLRGTAAGPGRPARSPPPKAPPNAAPATAGRPWPSRSSASPGCGSRPSSWARRKDSSAPSRSPPMRVSPATWRCLLLHRSTQSSQRVVCAGLHGALRYTQNVGALVQVPSYTCSNTARWSAESMSSAAWTISAATTVSDWSRLTG